MKKTELTEEFLINWWLEKYHGITVTEMIKKHPRLCKSGNWYKKYAVTQVQHDEWYSWAIDILSKTFHMSKKYTKRMFGLVYLNCAPSINKNKKL